MYWLNKGKSENIAMDSSELNRDISQVLIMFIFKNKTSNKQLISSTISRPKQFDN